MGRDSLWSVSVSDFMYHVQEQNKVQTWYNVSDVTADVDALTTQTVHKSMIHIEIADKAA